MSPRRTFTPGFAHRVVGNEQVDARNTERYGLVANDMGKLYRTLATAGQPVSRRISGGQPIKSSGRPTSGNSPMSEAADVLWRLMNYNVEHMHGILRDEFADSYSACAEGRSTSFDEWRG